jgi:hypothetical protein
VEGAAQPLPRGRSSSALLASASGATLPLGSVGGGGGRLAGGGAMSSGNGAASASTIRFAPAGATSGGAGGGMTLTGLRRLLAFQVPLPVG